MVSLKLILGNILQMRRFPRGNVMIGKHCWGLPYIVNSGCRDTVIIGNYCSFGRNCIIVPSNGHLPSSKELERFRVSTFPIAAVCGWKKKYALPNKHAYVIIGNDVWVGVNTVILSGVRIGDGAIIGAGAVVTHDVPAYAIVAGVPARIIRYRYTKEQRAKLREIAWWNWPDKVVAENGDYFYEDVEKFIKKFSIK
jgi:virginiamycin A acetyltransferase